MWVSFNIYRALTSKAPPSVSAQVSQPLTPTLDKDALDLIQGKLYLNDSQIPDNVTVGTPVPAATITPTEIPAPSQSPSPTPVATASAAPTATP